jgi:actin-like ATPase involved in cell morphogenesis
VVAIRTSANNQEERGGRNRNKRMLGRTYSNIAAIRPMKGVIADFSVCERCTVLHQRSSSFLQPSPRVLTVACRADRPVERRAVK